MKKNVLASSVAAALVGLGMAGAAHAEIALVVPYYTAQTEHATLLNIVNTDTANGKAVKVRFRGAANSDDVFDFQVFLSPGDVWTANISKGASGAAQLTTNDASCTKPAKATLNSTPFVTSRLNPALTAEQKAEQTREGYIEIFTMADIPKSSVGGYPDVATAPAVPDGVNDLYTAIKHVTKVAPCTGKAWTNLDTAAVGVNVPGGTSVASGTAVGLAKATAGLMANYTIVNVARAGAWDGEAVGVNVGTVDAIPYWPQTAATVAAPTTFSADPLFFATAQKATGSTTPTATKAAVKAGSYDLPDLSTPYAAGGNPIAQATTVTQALETTSVTNEFLTNSEIQAGTDWVFSMPTRRYWVAMDYAAVAAAAAVPGTVDDGRRFNDRANAYFADTNTTVSGGLICVSNVSRDIWDQEESNIVASTDVVVSPSTLPPATLFCGEASVLSVNGGAAKPTPTLNASVAVTDIDVGYSAGWMKLLTPGATAPGLPVVGSSFARAAAGDSFFAASWTHRTVNPN